MASLCKRGCKAQGGEGRERGVSVKMAACSDDGGCEQRVGFSVHAYIKKALQVVKVTDHHGIIRIQILFALGVGSWLRLVEMVLGGG